MEDPRETARTTADAGPEVPTLPLLLNVLYRRRLVIILMTLIGVAVGIAYGLVVGPYYRATAVVRPGIVSFNQEGAPFREWRHRDVISWFDKKLYWADMRAAIPEIRTPPRLIAEYLPSGGLYQESGDVIVLQYLSTDRSRAVRVLDTAIKSFNGQAQGDSITGGALYLTRIGIELRIAQMLNQRAVVEFNIAMLDREIERKHLLIGKLAADAERVGLDLRTNASAARAARDRLATAERTMTESTARIDAVRSTLDRLMAREVDTPVGEFGLAVAAMNGQFYRVEVQADSLRHAIRAADIDSLRLELKRGEDQRLDRLTLETEITDLELRRDTELPLSIAKVEAEIQGERSRLKLLTLLEPIGETSCTDRPVRPRKFRALAIVTGLAFFGSIGLAFGYEYIDRNRRVIFARSSPR